MQGCPTQPREGRGRWGFQPKTYGHRISPPMEGGKSRDDTLRFAFDQVKYVDGHLVRPDAAPCIRSFLL